MHFDGSWKHATLHTGIIYASDEIISFTTISDSMRHDLPTIWMHFKPILIFIKQPSPAITRTLCVFDGSTTQYRQKSNFFLLSTLSFDRGFIYVNWSTLEAGHEKCEANGICASLKCSADHLVAQGWDLPDVWTMLNSLQAVSYVKMYFVAGRNLGHSMIASLNEPCNFTRLSALWNCNYISEIWFASFVSLIVATVLSSGCIRLSSQRLLFNRSI